MSWCLFSTKKNFQVQEQCIFKLRIKAIKQLQKLSWKNENHIKILRGEELDEKRSWKLWMWLVVVKNSLKKLSCCRWKKLFHNTQNCSLTEVNVWKLHCCHKKGHKRMIYSRPIFYLVWLGLSHKCLQLHLNSATWLRRLLQKLLEHFGYSANIKEIWLIQTWTNT